MSTYNTNNPVEPDGSTDPRDLYDNAQNFDLALNSSGTTWIDRKGVTRKSMAGYDANYINVVNNLAPLGKVYSLAEANAAITAGEIADGAFFFVWSGDPNSIADKYQNIGGVATSVGKAYPATEYVSYINRRLNGGGVETTSFRDLLSQGIAESAARTRVDTGVFEHDGELLKVILFAEAAGSAVIKIIKRNGALCSLVSEFNVTLAVGKNEFISGVDFTAVSVTQDQTIGVYSNAGRISLVESSANSSYTYSGNLTGNNVTTTATPYSMQIQAVTLSGSAGYVYEDVAEKSVNTFNQLSGNAEQYGVYETTVDTVPEGAIRTRIIANSIATTGRIRKVSLNINTAGSGKIKLLRKESELVYSMITELSVTCSVGLNEFPVSWNVLPGYALGFYSNTAKITCTLANTGQIGETHTYTGDLTGSNITVNPKSGIGMLLAASIEVTPSYSTVIDMSSTALAKSEENAAAIANINLDVASLLRGSTSIQSQRFLGTSTPTDWALNDGVFSVNNGLVCSGTGGVSTTALYDKFSAMARKTTRARIKIATPETKIGICFSPPTASLGTAAIINGVNNTLEMYLYTGTALTLSRSISLPAALVANRSYLLTVRKVGITTLVTYEDTVTRQTVSLYQSNGDSGLPAGNQRGKSGIIHLAGSATVSKFEFIANVQQDPWWIILGDSLVEGNTNGADWDKCWGYLLEDERGKGDTLVAARGGESSASVLARLDLDLRSFSPKYVLYELGVNDATQAEWRTNTQTVINAIVAQGATPVLCTQIPTPVKQPQVTAQNNDIRNKFFGDFPYVDLALAVSVNNDGVTYNPVYYQSDTVHLTPEGERNLFEQVMIDAPYLLD